MRFSNSLLLSFLVSASLPACFVVDDSALKQAKVNALDAGVDGGDNFPAADQCVPNATNVPEIVIPTSGSLSTLFSVDTTMLHQSPSPPDSCTGLGGAPGNDGFYMLKAQAGQFYHFHVTPTSAGRDPIIYMLPSNCDTTSCGISIANRCGLNEAEHFGYRFPPSSSGTFYLAIDDKETGGGTYDVLAVRPICGNGTKEHGEGCDYAVQPPDPNCDTNCHVILSGATPAEVEINDDIYLSNSVSFALAGPVLVSGNLSGCDTDVYSFPVAVGDHINLSEKPAGVGMMCRPVDRAMTMRLVTASGVTKFTATEDANGCLVVDHTFLTGEDGQYFMLLEYNGVRTDPLVPYKMNFSRL